MGESHPSHDSSSTPLGDPHALAERLQFHALLLDVVGQAVIATDRTGAVTYWNAAAERLYGWTPEQAIGQPLVELIAGAAARDEMTRLLTRLVSRRASWSGELPLRHRNGEEVPALVTLAPLSGNGEVIGAAVVSPDVSALRQAERKVRDSEAQTRRLVAELRQLTAHLEVVREQEQARIAREIHDELGQMLTGIKLDVGWLQRRFALGGDELPAAPLRQRLEGVAELIDQTLDAVRHIARKLRPPALDDLGLGAALEWLVDEFRAHTGIPCELHIDLDDLAADGARDTAAFRILQEALTNVARHAAASRAWGDICLVGGDLVIDLRDDGKGLPPAAMRAVTSLGLIGMRERARACGGELTVRRLPRGGTRVRARLPLNTLDEDIL